MFASHRCQAIHVNSGVWRPDRATVEPQNILWSVVRHKLIDLVPGELFELLPLFRFGAWVIVGTLV